MKSIIIILVLSLLSLSCNSNSQKRILQRLVKYGSIDFKESNLRLIKFDEKTAGLKEEKIVFAVYEMQNVNLDSLGKPLLSINYKRLPATELVLGDGFGGNIKNSDSGYYKLTLSRGAMDELLILNMTQRKVIYYKNFE